MQQYSRYRRVGFAGVISIIALWLVGCGTLVTPAPSLQATASTAVVHPYPTPNGTQTLYSNALTTPAAGWASGPECSFTSNGLVVQPSGGHAYICLAPTASLADVSVTVTVQQTNGLQTHAYGIAFRHAAPKNYYFFGIDGKGRYTLTTVVNDISHTIIPFTAKAAIHSGANATNRLQVIARGNAVTLLVNDAPVGQATLTTYASGTIGLRGINNGSVTFQQLSIAKV